MILSNGIIALLDETFWVAVSIAMIVFIIFKYSKSPFKDSLATRANNIKNQIEEAQSLLKEAEDLLKEQKKLHKKYSAEADNSLQSIEKKIETLKQKAENDFNIKLKQRTSAIKERITNQQNRLLNNLRMSSVHLAIKATSIIIQKQDNPEANAQILTDSMNKVLAK
jgi:F0F1-type ATP synthase membrane subunit b/b'